MRRRAVLGTIAALVLFAWAMAIVGPLGGASLEGELAPDFSLPVVIGDGAGNDRLRLSDLRGHVVVLDFWASWCGPCRASVPMLSRLQNKFEARGLRIVGINSESADPRAFAQLQRSWQFGYPSVHDPVRETQVAYGVDAFPTMLLLDPEGVVQKVYQGTPTEAALQARIENLLD